MLATFVAAFNTKMVPARATHGLLLTVRRYSVTRSAPELVRPSEPTPRGLLPLSAIDNRPNVQNYVQVLFVYRRGQEAAKVIKQALSRALVPYYPVAGRLRRSQHRDDHKEVYCSDVDGGVVFVEASADRGLEDSGYYPDRLPLYDIPREQLLPSTPTEAEPHKPIFLMQVTQFKCGGFTIGIKVHHSFFDGNGLAQFMNAIAEISRGLRQPSIKPIWFRESVLDPQQLSFTDITPSSELLKEHAVDLSPDQIDQLKNNFTKETDEKCSSFDILTALIWRLRTKTMNLEPHTNVTLVFPINMQSNKDQVQPFRGGYYGNLVSLKTIKATSEYVCQATLAEMVNKLRDAKQRPLKESEEIELSYSTLSVSDWRYTGIFEVDYGWGAPTNIVPYPAKIDLSIGLCGLLRSPVFKGGVRLWTQCVWKEHLEAFLHEMKVVS